MLKHLAVRLAVAVLLATVDALAGADDDFFDDSVLHEIRLSVDASNWQALRDNYLLNTYYPSDFAWRDVTVTNIGIRSRGRGSRSGEKPNLNISFDRYVADQQFLGLTTITLKANNQDASMMAESLSMALLRRMGIPAPREAFVRLFVNEEFFGLYTLVEAVDKDFLSRAFGDSGGYLYEYKVDRQYHFEYLGDDPSEYSFLEPQTHKRKPELATLIEMIRTVNFASDESFLSDVSARLNVQDFMRLLAVESYVAENDGVLSAVYGMNNFYLHRPEDSSVFEFVPWDSDLAFTADTRPILEGFAENILARRAFENPELRRVYLEALVKAAIAAGKERGWLEQEARRQYDLIAEDARTDPHKQCITESGIESCSAQEFEDRASGLFGFAAQRTPFVVQQVAKLLPESPQLDEGGVRNLATGEQLLAPGSLAVVHGSSFAKTLADVGSFPYPFTLEGTNVNVNGVAAAILSVSSFEAVIQVPWRTAEGTAIVELSTLGGSANPLEITIARTAPGILDVVHGTDLNPITPSRPAEAGEMITIYAAGLGPVIDPPQDGNVPKADSSRAIVDPIEVSIGGQSCRIESSGLASGLVGIYQVYVEIPPDIISRGRTPVRLTIGGQTSPAFSIRLK